MLRAAALAVELTSLGARFVVVGSAAPALRRVPGTPEPRDLDLVVERRDLPVLVAAVTALGGVTTVARLERCRDVHIDTAWGPLDVFVAARPASLDVDIDGCVVRVAA